MNTKKYLLISGIHMYPLDVVSGSLIVINHTNITSYLYSNLPFIHQKNEKQEQ
jgi:hypothetical protein